MCSIDREGETKHFINLLEKGFTSSPQTSAQHATLSLVYCCVCAPCEHLCLFARKQQTLSQNK